MKAEIHGLAKISLMVALVGWLGGAPGFAESVIGEPQCEVVTVKSAIDGSMQPAIVYLPKEAPSQPVPLVVVLHTWGSSFSYAYSTDILKECRRNGWNWAVVEPYYRGPNDQPEACASDLAVQDVLDAIGYVKTKVNIDTQRIYVVGVSGGGHMAMILAGRAPHVWAGVSAWVGQADLKAWYAEMKAWPDPVFWPYWINLEEVCGGPPGTSPEIDEQYRLRSPLTHLPRAGGVAIDINAGIDDGHTGCVPISHSLRAFNVLAEANGRPERKLTDKQIESLTKRREIPPELLHEPVREPGRQHNVLFRRQAGPARLTVFDGGHEGDMPTATRWLASQVKKSKSGEAVGDLVMDRIPAAKKIHPAADSKIESAIPSRSRYLLLDDRVVQSFEGARLRLGEIKKHPSNPLFGEQFPWEPRFDNLHGNVVFDEEEKIYKLWYNPFVTDLAMTMTPPEKRVQDAHMEEWKPPKDRPAGTYLRELDSISQYPSLKGFPVRDMGVCYAASHDGLAWNKPGLDVIPFLGRQSNILVWGPIGAGVFKDPRERDPERRYKMFFANFQTVSVAFSRDGLHWGDWIGCPEVDVEADTHNNAFWAPELNKYVGITRLWEKRQQTSTGLRLVARTESDDFIHWTKGVEVLRGTMKEQTYTMTAFRHADVYFGLLAILRKDEGRVHCELAWSPDTYRWERIEPGVPFIPNSSEDGDYDWGCVYACDNPVFLEDEIRLYYMGSDGPHEGWRESVFALATLRPDGLAGYEPTSKDAPGVVITKPVICGGKRLWVTADAQGGSIRVDILDQPLVSVEAYESGKHVRIKAKTTIDSVGGELPSVEHSEPITGEVTDQVVRWKGVVDLSEYQGKPIQLRFELDRARLYSFGFSD